MLVETLKKFPEQFNWSPEIKNEGGLDVWKNTVVAGIGGSNLAARVLAGLEPQLNIIIHNDYGLPLNIENPQETLLVASSHSGNTEETLDTLKNALERGLKAAAITSGGALLELAQKEGLPHIEIPKKNIQPRFALGYGFAALVKMLGLKELSDSTAALAGILDSNAAEAAGGEIAEKLKNKVPVIYSSRKNKAAGHIWKIKFNETAKIPAFANVFPELNHNEMTGFDVKEKTAPLAERFRILMLKDETDHPKIIKRMAATKSIYERQGLGVEVVNMEGGTPLQKIFQSLMTADWTSYYLADFYGNDPNEVPLVEEFKKLIA